MQQPTVQPTVLLTMTFLACRFKNLVYPPLNATSTTPKASVMCDSKGECFVCRSNNNDRYAPYYRRNGVLNVGKFGPNHGSWPPTRSKAAPKCYSNSLLPCVGILSEIRALVGWHHRLMGQTLSGYHLRAEPAPTTKTSGGCVPVMLRGLPQHSSRL